MNATPTLSSQPSLTVIHVLAELLERLDGSPIKVDAAQYQSVVDHLAGELAQVQQGGALSALLDTHPAAAELYENLNYQHAGLCRSSLDASLAAEQQARKAIASAMNGSKQGKQQPQLRKGSTDEQS